MIGRHRRLVALAAIAALAAGAAPEASAATTRRRTTSKPRRAAPRRPPGPAVVLVADPSSPDDVAVGEACKRGLGTLQGSVVAMDPYSGRVIAVVNPSIGVERAYQPCSVFKIVVATAGLSEGVITPETRHTCNGGCWLWPGHGSIDLRRALAVSCNPYFEWVGEKLGYAKVQEYARLLGLGTPSGVNVEQETGGVVPLFVPPSLVGYVSSHAKGVATTAVQLGVLISATINGGVIYTPQLAGRNDFVPRARWHLPPTTVTSGLAEGFLSAVNEGSASTAFDPDVMVAGKTGTCAGVGWLASYAPADHPRIVIVTFLNPGSGHLASTVAGRIYQYLYKPAAPPAMLGGG